MINIRDVLKDWDRAIKLSRKPRRDEFMTIAKITGLGILVIGLVGFAIRMIIQLKEYFVG